MVGTALSELFPSGHFVGSADCDLRSSQGVEDMFNQLKPTHVVHLAAKVGGIKANTENPATFYYDNIMINTNVLESARRFRVKKVLSLLSTCIFPDDVLYPLTEDQIHNGVPHRSNYAYAYAKRMLDVQSRAYRDQFGCNFITLVPNNLFGENDNFDLNDSHLIPALIRKIDTAKQKNKDVVLWGDGSPLREFTYAKDLAKIVLLLLDKYNNPEPINVGNTGEHSIREVAEKVASIMKYNGNIVWDTSEPNGQQKKPSDNSRLQSLGWREEDYTPFAAALEQTCRWYLDNYPNVRGIK